MNILELFEVVGGTDKAVAREKAAELCGVSVWATYKWDADGIPPKHWKTFAQASGLGVEVIAQVTPAPAAAEAAQ